MNRWILDCSFGCCWMAGGGCQGALEVAKVLVLENSGLSEERVVIQYQGDNQLCWLNERDGG